MNRLRLRPTSQLLARAQQSSTRSRRWIHHVRALPYAVEEGMGEFLSPQALKTVAVDYQQGLLERLNELVKDTELESQSVVQTVLSSATDRSQAMTYNYASEALNNSFFLDQLKPPSSHESQHLGHEQGLYNSPSLLARIESNFGSVTQLKSNVSAAALGMMGSGWVWVASNQVADLAVIPTYGPGTILARSGQVQSIGINDLVAGEDVKATGGPRKPAQDSPLSRWSSSRAAGSPSSGSPTPRDAPVPSKPTSPPSRSLSLSTPAHSTYGASTRSLLMETSMRTPGSFEVNPNLIMNDVYPLFCVSVHEHAWLLDYGVWGKEEYLKRFWASLDWDKVSKLWGNWAAETKKNRMY